MKTTHILMGLMITGTLATAGSVGSLTTFKANTTAKAAEVNGNFSAIKKAADGNAADITTNQKAIKDNKTAIGNNQTAIQTNKTDIANKISSVLAATDGGLEATRTGNDVEIKQAAGFISISDRALHSMDNTECFLKHELTGLSPSYLYSYFLTSSATDDCKAYASVQLPDKATMSDMTCRVVYDTAATGNSPIIRLIRQQLTNGEISMTFYIGGLTKKAGVQTVNDDSPVYGNDVVENQTYAYFISFDNGGKTKTDGDKIRFYNCTIEYEF